MPGIKYIAAGFVQDVEKLLTDFVKENSKEFSVFTHFWKKYSFAAIFLGRSSAELFQFTQEIFQLTLKFLLSADLCHQIGAVYMLYALFRNQIVVPPIRIRIVLKQYEHFLELSEIAIKEKCKSLHYVIGYLMEHGFDYVAHLTLCGPRNSKHGMEMEKKSLQMACLLKDIKNHSSSLFKSNSLERILELNKVYTELTKSIPFGNSVFQEDNDFDMETHLKKLSKLMGGNTKDSESSRQIKEERDNIGMRRAQIKSNAFAAKAWFRKLNPTDDEEEDEDYEGYTRALRKSLSRKAKRPKDLSIIEEDEESVEKEVKPKKRRRRYRIPKDKRRVGRPRKVQEPKETPVEDISDINPFKGIKKRGPVARSSYLDRYIELPFKEADNEITVLSSTSEEEEKEEVESSEEQGALVIFDKAYEEAMSF